MDAAAMSTKRKPLNRPPALQITPLAIRLFTEMAAVSCTCEARDWGGKYWEHKQCAGCERWWELHAGLYDELRCRPWEWPCIQSPEAECPYPPGSPAAQSWRPNERAQQMWQALAGAAREARRTQAALEAAEAQPRPNESPQPMRPAPSSKSRSVSALCSHAIDYLKIAHQCLLRDLQETESPAVSQHKISC